MAEAPSIAAVESALAGYRLIARGGFNSTELPEMQNGRQALSVVLVGVAGSNFWAVFSASAEYADGGADSLDRWSRRIGDDTARLLGAEAVFPFDGPPYLPFLSWAAQAETIETSQLGMLIHPRYGLWHAWRFALLFPTPLGDAVTPGPASLLCDSCSSKACLASCPVDAFSKNGYDVERCYRFLAANTDAPCHSSGCLARRACPVGSEHRYADAHAAFHMAAFLKAQSKHFDDN